MTNKVKSGRELLDEFFAAIPDINGVDREIAIILNKLYREGKLTDTNLSSELERMRKEELDED